MEEEKGEFIKGNLTFSVQLVPGDGIMNLKIVDAYSIITLNLSSYDAFMLREIIDASLRVIEPEAGQ